MTFPRQHDRAVSEFNELPPRRPKTLLQRLSSGIAHALPSVRASSSGNVLIDRPTTLPGSLIQEGSNIAESKQLLMPDRQTTSTGEPAQPCPYDSDSYLSFTSIEKRRCSFCGMRGPKVIFNEPCHACKTGGPGSHIASAGTHRRHSAIDARHLAHIANSSDSVFLGPRIVTPERAAKRIGNPPRVSRLPAGIIRLPVSNDTNIDRSRDPFLRPPSTLGVKVFGGDPHSVHLQDSRCDGQLHSKERPVSPKLHHLPLLPHSENHPFVYRHEIPRHAIALRAGSNSPLTDRNNSPTVSSYMRGATDYSNAVYYGGRVSPIPSTLASMGKPQTTTVVIKEIQPSGKASIDLYASSLDAALAETAVYRKRSPQQAPAKPARILEDTTDSSRTFGSQDTGSTGIGNMRLELRGGDGTSAGTPVLRGGSGHERLSIGTFTYKLKRWILLCPPCFRYQDESDDDLPPARVVAPERVAKMRQKMNGTAPVPPHLCRGAASVASSASTTHTRLANGNLVLAPVCSSTISTPPKRSLSSRFPISALFHGCPESPINQPAPITTVQVPSPPFPRLRGGAESPANIPPTLFWVAGGTGRKSISFAGWRQSRPKQRMGGLFGMTVFGDRYGQEYKVEAGVSSDVEVGCSTSVKVIVEEGTSVSALEGGTDVVRSVSSSNSGASSNFESAKEIATEAEKVAPVRDAGFAQRALTPPPIGPVEDVPMCSGALPLESKADLSSDAVTLCPLAEGSDEHDAVVYNDKKSTIAEAEV